MTLLQSQLGRLQSKGLLFSGLTVRIQLCLRLFWTVVIRKRSEKKSIGLIETAALAQKGGEK